MKKYMVLYADPPWRYRNKPNGRSPESHYPTMKTEDICALPVQALAAEDCALFLWVTMPMIFEAQKVLAAWGFRYKTVAFVWVKQNRKGTGIFWGMGYWTRANAELCLLATKGRPQRRANNVHQVIISPVEEHSKKPEEARRRIEALLGDVPRLELFARRPSPGWDVWGNEVESDVVLEQTQDS
ncbi:MAG: MT-A70 family methyltransferase [Candidatus Limivicinus sp.]